MSSKKALLDEHDPEFEDKIKEIDVISKKNRLSVKWFREEYEGDKFKWWLSKKRQDGVAFCRLCHKDITYRKMGKKALFQHAKGRVHKANVKVSNLLNTLIGLKCIKEYFLSLKSEAQCYVGMVQYFSKKKK